MAEWRLRALSAGTAARCVLAIRLLPGAIDGSRVGEQKLIARIVEDSPEC